MANNKKKPVSPNTFRGLDHLREQINRLDERILDTLNERTRLVLDIAEIKRKTGLSSYAPHREQQVYERLLHINKGIFPDKAVMAVYREIMSASIALEKPLKVAYLGPEASFSHLACLRKFGSNTELAPLDTIASVFTEVEKGWADFGVVPIENSTDGVINHTLDMFIDSDLRICSEIIVNISHNLIGFTTINKIKKIYSRDTIFAQCRLWLMNNTPQAKLIPVSSSTQGVQMVKRNSFAAAIGSEVASSLYSMPVIARSIEDCTDNQTRFLVIGKSDAERSGNDKTSIVFSIKDKVGALYETLRPFNRYKINMTKIESRPSKRKAWDYVFFIDFIGYKSDPIVAKALNEVSDHCAYFKILGSYPVSSIK